MTSLLPSPQSILWALAAVVAVWGISVAWRSWRVKGRWQAALLGLLLQPVALLILGLSARVPGDAYALNIWTLAGWVTLYYGLLVVLVGVRRDPSRGRPRCPKCWYDMSGAGTDTPTCPECGRVMRSSRDLFRTRRAGVLVALGLLVVLASYPVFVWERIRARPWPGVLPTTLLVAAMPWLPESLLTRSNTFPRRAGTLAERFEKAPKDSVTRRMIRARARGLVEGSNDLQHFAHALPFLEHEKDADLFPRTQLAVARAIADPETRALAVWCTQWSAGAADDASEAVRKRLPDLVPGFLSGLDDPAPDVAMHCAGYLSMCGRAAEPAVDRLLRRVEESGPKRRTNTAMSLWDIARESGPTRAKMVDKARTTADPEVRDAMISALSGEGISDPVVKTLLMEDLRGPDDGRSRRAARALGRQKTADAVEVEAIVAQWHANRSEPQSYLYALSRLGPLAWEHYPILMGALASPSEQVRSGAASALEFWAHDGWDPGPVEPGLRSLAEAGDKDVALAAQMVLQHLRSTRKLPSP